MKSSREKVAATTGAMIAGLAVLASFSGVITDPLQRRLGWHQRRLDKLIDALEAGFFESDESRYRPKDAYAARVFDVLDILRAAATGLR